MTIFCFYFCLLMSAVIKEQSASCTVPFFYYTTLSVICKFFFTGITFFHNKLVFLVISIQSRPLGIRLPNPVSRPIIGIADRITVTPFFQKLPSDIIIIRDIQRTVSLRNVALCRTCLCAHFRCPVSVSVILICKGKEHLFSYPCIKANNVSISVIGISSLHAVAIADAANSVQGIIAIAHFQTVIIINSAPAT